MIKLFQIRKVEFSILKLLLSIFHENKLETYLGKLNNLMFQIQPVWFHYDCQMGMFHPNVQMSQI